MTRQTDGHGEKPSTSNPITVDDQGTLSLIPQYPGVKVFPHDTPQAIDLVLAGARNEGVCGQVVIHSTHTVENITPRITALTGSAGTFPTSSVFLYWVGYVSVQVSSDTDPNTGTHPPVAQPQWPDALYPLGPDACLGEVRHPNFDLTIQADVNQPVWIEARIPKDTASGNYSGRFEVADAQGTVIASTPLQLTVWDITLPDQCLLTTRFGLSPDTAYAAPYNGNPPASLDETALTKRYVSEGLAHRVTLDGPTRRPDVTYNGNKATIDPASWADWDSTLEDPRRTTYPLPCPGPFCDPDNPDIATCYCPGKKIPDPGGQWSTDKSARATSFWQQVDQHYIDKGWLERSYFYCYDEFTFAKPSNTVPEQEALVVSQSNALFATGHPPVRAMAVCDTLDPTVAQNGHIGIWVPIVTNLHSPVEEQQRYAPERQKGARIWWYDSNASRFTVDGVGAVFPDHLIDHAGVNELVHGPMTYVYGFTGYLYYETVQGYEDHGAGVWQANYTFNDNGDGTLFYPGVPAIIGGPPGSDIPVPSIRLQLLRQSISLYELLVLLSQRDRATADSLAAQLVTDAQHWATNPALYEQVRMQVAQHLQGGERERRW